MDLRVRDVAALLGVSENTVYRWVKDGALPSHRAGEQLRINRVDLQEWAAANGQRVPPELFSPAAGAGLSLAAALERGGVHLDVPGDDREAVLAAVAALPGVPAPVDRARLAELLIRRESLASTAVGEGIAFPHPRDPLVVGVEEPRVLLSYLARPVDFGAMDGAPVRVLFTLLAPSVRQHLRMLARLAWALHDPALRAALARRASGPEILERVRALEAGAPPSDPDPAP